MKIFILLLCISQLLGQPPSSVEDPRFTFAPIDYFDNPSEDSTFASEPETPRPPSTLKTAFEELFKIHVQLREDAKSIAARNGLDNQLFYGCYKGFYNNLVDFLDFVAVQYNIDDNPLKNVPQKFRHLLAAANQMIVGLSNGGVPIATVLSHIRTRLFNKLLNVLTDKLVVAFPDVQIIEIENSTLPVIPTAQLHHESKNSIKSYYEKVQQALNDITNSRVDILFKFFKNPIGLHNDLSSLMIIYSENIYKCTKPHFKFGELIQQESATKFAIGKFHEIDNALRNRNIATSIFDNVLYDAIVSTMSELSPAFEDFVKLFN